MLCSVSTAKICTFCPRSSKFRQRSLFSSRVPVHASLRDNGNGVKVEYTPRLIVGLGNRYFAEHHAIKSPNVNRGCIGEVPILLAKPQAYMNFSGEVMSLPNGILRLAPKGGHGHHNGIKSVIDNLDGCREFPRLCIGIGNPRGTMDMKAFLLQKFSSTEREQIDAALEQRVDAVRMLVLN